MKKYTVWSRGKPVVCFFVAQEINNKSDLPVAEFPVNSRYDSEIQELRALDYCRYMNKLVEAAKIAYEQNQLINILKS